MLVMTKPSLYTRPCYLAPMYRVTIMPWYEVTVYDLLKNGMLVMTTSAAAQLAQRLLKPALSPYQVLHGKPACTQPF